MFLAVCTRRLIGTRLPHGRGDVSNGIAFATNFNPSSPRAWGCFRADSPAAGRVVVFPTGVGMFLTAFPPLGSSVCLPHGRGDVSALSDTPQRLPLSSPRAWGCFPLHRKMHIVERVFPTGVGMFPMASTLYASRFCLPHGRGDVSASFFTRLATPVSSPRAWGCFR